MVAVALGASCDDGGESADSTDVGSTATGTSDVATTTASSATAATVASSSATSSSATSAATTGAPTTATPTTVTPTTVAPPADPLSVATTAGDVAGGPSAVDGVRNFLAIPYGEAPMGDRAFAPPEPRAMWEAPFDATLEGASCPQSTEGITAQIVITPDPDPDCLTLSVWSPEDATDLPVMVWFHGGGFTAGSAHSQFYNGDDLAAEGVVVVNVNYRLGPQGFLATSQLRDEQGGAVGNWGLLDQQLALEWVRDNAAAFGGDADNVTIFGESAGGFSVCGHLAAPSSAGLFQRAIIQSGGGCGRLTSEREALRSGRRFMRAIGCDDLECLRATPDDELIAAEGFNAGLVADGETIGEAADALAARGEASEVEVLIGSNADEATLFTIGLEVADDAALRDLVANVTDDPDALLALYPSGEFETPLARYQAISTDVSFTCPALEFASVWPGAYLYHYTWISPQNPAGLGATHGAEIAPLFSHPDGLALDIEPNALSDEHSEMLQRAWVDFATSGNPGEGFAPYDDEATIARIDDTIQAVDSIRGDRCGGVTDLSTLNR